MEACATSHYWGRVAQRSGHDVRLIPPIYMKPFVKRQKHDAAVAAAIAEAVLHPNTHCPSSGFWDNWRGELTEALACPASALMPDTPVSSAS